MESTQVIDAASAAIALEALLPVLADLTSAANEGAASAAVIEDAPRLAKLLQEAAAVAEVIALINRRAQP